MKRATTMQLIAASGDRPLQAPRLPLDLLDGRYVRIDGTMTDDIEEADTYRPAGPDEDTWRPPPR